MKKALLAAVAAVTLISGCAITADRVNYPQGGVLIRAENLSVKVLTQTGSGTGTWVSPTHVLTAKHVLGNPFGEDAWDEVKLLLPDGSTVDAKVMMQGSGGPKDYSHDWALLEVSKEDRQDGWAKVQCYPPQVGEQIATYGHALGKPGMPFLGQIEGIDFDTGAWAGGADIWSHGFITSMDTAGGVSGAGVYNMAGKLIGLLVGQLVFQNSPFQSIVYPVAYTHLCDTYDEHADPEVTIGVRG